MKLETKLKKSADDQIAGSATSYRIPFRAGAWYVNFWQGDISYSVRDMPDKYFSAYPCYTTKRSKVTKMAIYAPGGVQASLACIRAGIYKDNGSHFPGDLVVDAGFHDLNSSAWHELVISQWLEAYQIYWVATLVGLQGAATAYTSAFEPYMGDWLLGNLLVAGQDDILPYIGYAITTQNWGGLPSTFPGGASIFSSEDTPKRGIVAPMYISEFAAD